MLARRAPSSTRLSSPSVGIRILPTKTVRGGALLSALSRTHRQHRNPLPILSGISGQGSFRSHPHEVNLSPLGEIGNVKVKNKFDIVLIHNGDKGYEITYKGTAAQDPIELKNYLRRREHSIEWVFRKWIQDPKVALFYDGVAVVGGKETEEVTLLNNQDDSVDVYLDVDSHYPVKISYSWRDPKDRQKDTEDEVYDGYKLVQGIWTPHSITRYFNGESSQQRFIATASYNLKLPDSMFVASVNYDPMRPTKR